VSFNIKRRLLIGGPILIVLGFIIYALRGIEAVRLLPVIGVIVLIIGVIYKPKKKVEPTEITE
jgi:hypothetical protein